MKSKDKFPLGLSELEDFVSGGGKKEKYLLEAHERKAISCVLGLVPEASKMFNDVFGKRDLTVEIDNIIKPKDEVAKSIFYRIAQIGLVAMMNRDWHCGGKDKHDKLEHQKALADIVEKFESSMN